MKRFLAVLFLCLATTGCAFTEGKVDVGYDLKKAEVGPLSSVVPLKVGIEDLKDSRPDRSRVGHKTNGLGMDTADVVTKKPVPEILKTALTALFEKNGHLSKQSEAKVFIGGEIKQFWLEFQMNMMTVEFLGTITLDLAVKDAAQKTIFSREYQGHYTEKKAAGLMGTWEEVFNIALEKLMYQIGTDQDLIKVLTDQAPQVEKSATVG